MPYVPAINNHIQKKVTKYNNFDFFRTKFNITITTDITPINILLSPNSGYYFFHVLHIFINRFSNTMADEYQLRWLAVLNGIALLAREAVILGLLYIFFGSLIAWVASLCLYGFGQLIENSDRIAGRVGEQDASACPQDKANPNQSAPDRNDGEL